MGALYLYPLCSDFIFLFYGLSMGLPELHHVYTLMFSFVIFKMQYF